MNNEDLNPNALPEFQMPRNLLNQIYEFTGSTEQNKGFILGFVDQTGSPQIISHASSPIIEMGIRKAVEEYLSEFGGIVLPGVDPEEQE
ncbi:MAG: hypothetical protein CMO74_14460 [Verrucomicrobiales bacterium]|nr:hypothetical protein [Verrucomicrobiales bacterium]|tara:strand:+ start:484 stop:750 length:267 start_codon:yes stop_codon:yes gene_type:complete